MKNKIFIILFSTFIIITPTTAQITRSFASATILLDTMNTRLRKLEAIMKDNLAIADSTSKLYQRNIKLSEDINKFTKSNYELSKQLVFLGEDNKKSSDSMNSYTEQLIILTYVLVGFSFIQFLYLLYSGGSQRKLVKILIEKEEFSKRLVRNRNKRARAYQRRKIKLK